MEYLRRGKKGLKEEKQLQDGGSGGGDHTSAQPVLVQVLHVLSSCYTSNNLGQTVFLDSPTQTLLTSLVAVSMKEDLHT